MLCHLAGYRRTHDERKRTTFLFLLYLKVFPTKQDQPSQFILVKKKLFTLWNNTNSPPKWKITHNFNNETIFTFHHKIYTNNNLLKLACSYFLQCYSCLATHIHFLHWSITRTYIFSILPQTLRLKLINMITSIYLFFIITIYIKGKPHQVKSIPILCILEFYQSPIGALV